jgi:hypothetical protein
MLRGGLGFDGIDIAAPLASIKHFIFFLVDLAETKVKSSLPSPCFVILTFLS